MNLRMTVDSCTFVPGSVQVTAAGDTLRLTQAPGVLMDGGPRRRVRRPRPA